MPYPVYSQRFASVRNYAGTLDILNDSANVYIVRTVTAYYGGLGACNFGFNDENDAGMLSALLGPATNPLAIWSDLHLVWVPGVTWQLSTNLGTDMTVHGYALGPP